MALWTCLREWHLDTARGDGHSSERDRLTSTVSTSTATATLKAIPAPRRLQAFAARPTPITGSERPTYMTTKKLDAISPRRSTGARWLIEASQAPITRPWPRQTTDAEAISA